MTQTEQQKQDRTGQQGQVEVSPEVVPGPRRRIFSREYKLHILAEADACEWGEIGALLRRERLHSSTLTKWRQQQAAGRLEEPGERKPRKEEILARENAQLRREKAQLEAKLRLANNRPGAEALAAHLAELAQAGNVDSIHVAAEATSNFWLPFFAHLQQAESLSEWPLTLYPFNPRVIVNFRKSFSDLDKTDLLDAHVISERLRFGRDLPEPFAMEALYLPLRTLTRYRYHLVGELVRVKSYTLSLVYLKASAYNVSREKRPFADVFGATSQAVLREFQSLEEVAAMPRGLQQFSAKTAEQPKVAMPFDDLVEWLDVKGKRRFADPKDNARRLQKVAEDSYQLPEEWLASVNTALSLSLRHLNTLQQLLARTDTPSRNRWNSSPIR